MMTPKPRMPTTYAGMRRRPSMYEPPPAQPPSSGGASTTAPQVSATAQRTPASAAAPMSMPNFSKTVGGAQTREAGVRTNGVGNAPPPKMVPPPARPVPPNPGMATLNLPTLGGNGPQYPASVQNGPTPAVRPAGNDTPMGPPTGIRPLNPESVGSDVGSRWQTGEPPRTAEQWAASLPTYWAGGGWLSDRPTAGLFEDAPQQPISPTYDVNASSLYTGPMTLTRTQEDPSDAQTRLASHARAAEAADAIRQRMLEAARLAQAQQQRMGAQAPGSSSKGTSGIGSGYNPLLAASPDAQSTSAAASDSPQQDLGNGIAGAPSAGPSEGLNTHVIISHGAPSEIADGQIPVSGTDYPGQYRGMSPTEVARALQGPPWNYKPEDAQKAAAFLSSGGWAVDLESGSVYQIHGDSTVGDQFEEFNLSTSPENWADASGELSDQVDRDMATASGSDASSSSSQPPPGSDELRRRIENDPGPQHDDAALNDLIAKQRQRQAYELARATQMAMEGAARTGASPESQMGLNADVAQASGLSAAEQEAQTRYQDQQAYDAQRFQWLQQTRALLMDLYKSSREEWMFLKAQDFAKEMAEIQARNQRRNIAYADQFSPSAGEEILKGALNVATGGISGFLGGLGESLGG